MKTATRVSGEPECGGVVINGASFFRSFEMPFGGYKFSGIGTEGVMSTLDEITHTKTVVLKTFSDFIAKTDSPDWNHCVFRSELFCVPMGIRMTYAADFSKGTS